MNEYEGVSSPRNFHLNTLQEGVLARGMAENVGNATTEYYFDESGDKRLRALDDINTGMLVEKFKRDPKDALAHCRQNLFAIMADPKLPRDQKTDRLERYLDAFFKLHIKLDRLAFPPLDEMRSGVPEYIPDGMTDMGSDPELNANNRSREKIRIDKEDILGRQAKQLFIDIFSGDHEGVDSDRLKTYIVKMVAMFVHKNMPYDKSARPFPNMSHSVNLTESYDKKLSVCRHHALYTQVLLQAFGITSRLLKCSIELDAHACNLVRINGQWHLLDTTNPDEENGEYKAFLKHIAPKGVEIDTRKSQYRWNVVRASGAKWTYLSRNDMYWRINDNTIK